MFEKYVVSEPVVNLRREPSFHSGSYEMDLLQESQLLLDEPLLGFETREGWIKVEAPEQSCFKSEWRGYPGWVRASEVRKVDRFETRTLIVHGWEGRLHIRPDSKSDSLCRVSLGTKLHSLDELRDWWEICLGDGRRGYIAKNQTEQIERIRGRDNEEKRSRLIEIGKQFLGNPYLWGGRSSYRSCDRTLTSVDCSGFSSLLYLVAHGIEIPRDAHDQFLKCSPCEPKQLREGDFIFLASLMKPERMNHVMLYAGGDEILEATEQTRSVQITTFKNKLGVSLDHLSHGARTEKYLVFFGIQLLKVPV